MFNEAKERVIGAFNVLLHEETMADNHLACLSDQLPHLPALQPRHEDLSLVEQHTRIFAQISTILHPLPPLTRFYHIFGVLLVEGNCCLNDIEGKDASLHEFVAIVVQLILESGARDRSMLSINCYYFGRCGREKEGDGDHGIVKGLSLLHYLAFRWCFVHSMMQNILDQSWLPCFSRPGPSSNSTFLSDY